ncbi:MULTISPECIES: 3,4-dihydroxy-2-butanone-4-phosphate synthase [unclassified Pseudomonas]|jgi:3,4-dihydroxy 2-butanone 4-phosphate synthase/GTP cyclohydrolase II|uniref:3,4-dihydroxy-2-butanone-4-phosphate synthase n=1 Tax=unclassified Pseudomonas TaxID=196821 RepID=UPI00129E39BF|nr:MULTISPECIES: 3,4-dihydroxy-2-butanone-4-phosphate synthase [unclassified Pseudomonas]MDH4654423.1 3,4-dihydroxy-2-butanone-4-phosphate synthase [Pseudomonas sp. BN606]MRK24279.1 3,4-dihydroxy-2-butanone-4-phosphate synthase [Pseudomonas sp. JG-B]
MDSPQRLIEAMASGAMLVVTDDDEGEGSLVISAGRADAAAINFMAREARGLICLALTEERCKTLGLELMVPNSRARHGMGFTLSIEARTGVSTGISAADRARTIEVAVDPASSASDLVQPGHIFPLRAQPGGVMQRAGHVEAACDLARLAGLIPAAVLVGILDEDGEPARGQTLREFAQRHGLPLGSVADLIHYRILHEGTIRRSGEYPIQTRHGEFRVITYLDDYQGQLHLALVRGEVHRDRPALVRVQAAETLRDLLDSHPGQWNLDRSLARVAEEGAGVVVLLAQQETPAALIEQLQQGTHKPRPPSFPQRTLGIGAQILRDVGVRKMRLLSFPVNYKAVSGFELEVVEFVSFDQEQA